MLNTIVEIMVALGALLTPILVVLFGLKLNKKLEISKSAISKEREWQAYWALKFLEVSNSYNSIVSIIVTELFELQRIASESREGREEKIALQKNKINEAVQKLQLLDWEIKNFIQFSPKNGETVRKSQANLFSLLSELLKTRSGDLEKIRKVQFEFNNSVRLAHAEMLDINVAC